MSQEVIISIGPLQAFWGSRGKSCDTAACVNQTLAAYAEAKELAIASRSPTCPNSTSIAILSA